MLTIKRLDIFSDWLTHLRDRQARAKIIARIDRLASGNAGDATSVGHGVSELRIHYGPGYRIYFTRRGIEIVVLLCGGDKSLQQADIRQAHRLVDELED